MRILVLTFAGSVALAAAACGLDSNGLGEGDGGASLIEAGSPVDGTVPSDDAGGVVPSDDGGQTENDSGGVTGDTGSDSGSVADANHPPDSCAPTEICNNGIDDNCNGLIDCADPECTAGWTCTAAAIPSGWTIVEYVQSGQPACSTGYGSPTQVVEGPTGNPANCNCACDVTTPGSCTSGDFAVTSNGFGGTASCGGIATNSAANGGACSPATTNYTPPAGGKLQIAPAPYSPGACTPMASQTVPPVMYAGNGEICNDTTTSGGGCSGGGVCAPAAAGNGFSLCVAHSGTPACPSGFSKSYVVGNGVDDTRGCSACTCGGATAQPCGNALLTLFPDSNCSDGGASIQANNSCNAVPGAGSPAAPTYIAYEYAAGPVQGEACSASPVSPTGSVTLTESHTVCCQ